jgi:hypothetical protein
VLTEARYTRTPEAAVGIVLNVISKLRDRMVAKDASQLATLS